MKILIIRRGALGDTVVSLPLVEILKRHYRDCYIEVIGDKNYWSLAVPKYADKITSPESDCIHSLYTDKLLIPQVAGYYTSFDLIIGFVNDREGTVKNHFSEMGISNCIFKKPFTEDAAMHIVSYTLGVLEQLGIQYDRFTAPELELGEAEIDYARSLLSKLNTNILVSIHPRTYGIKALPIEQFIELGKWIESELSGRAVWILGPVEEENIDILQETFGSESIIFTTDLKKVAAVISCTDYYVGCDTGITHLAAATGVKTIPVFGPTNPDIWGSLGDNVKIIKAADIKTFDTKIIKDIIVDSIGTEFNERVISRI